MKWLYDMFSYLEYWQQADKNIGRIMTSALTSSSNKGHSINKL